VDAKSGIPHIHLVANRVDDNGLTNDDHYIAERAMAAAHLIEQQYGWSNPEDVSREHVRQITQDCMKALESMPSFDWDVYSRHLSICGYQVKLRRDKDGKVVGYNVRMGNSNYKASLLGNKKDLNASNIEKTWRRLHPAPIQQKPATATVKPVSTTHDVQPNLSIVVNRSPLVSQHIQVEYQHYDFDVPKDVCDFIQKESSIPGTETFTPEEVSQVALLLFAGYLDGATSLAASCGGGGSSNDLAWGRDPKEEDREWAHRCVRLAKKLGQPNSYRRKR
jgi:hypothetical protein